MNLSQYPFACGVRKGVFNSLMPELIATAEKCMAYFLSRSRIRYFGPLPHGVASLNCYAVHSSVGCFVTLVWTIRRVFNSITTNTYHCRNNQSVTIVKSHAQTPLAWFFKKVAQVWLDKCSFLSFGISGWFVYSLPSPTSTIHRVFSRLPITDSLSPSLESR